MSSSGCIDKYFQRTKVIVLVPKVDQTFLGPSLIVKPHRHVKATIFDEVRWVVKEGRKPPKGGKYYVCQRFILFIFNNIIINYFFRFVNRFFENF